LPDPTAISPERVRPDRLDERYPGTEADQLRLAFSAANVAWRSHHRTRAGASGGARGATAGRDRPRLELPPVERLGTVTTEAGALAMPTT
jgi:hypothetical protein